MSVFRSYAIERDEAGLPARMVWRGDFQTIPVVYVTCPRLKCKGRRLVRGRCFSCWGDYSHVTRQVRIR